MSRFGLDYAWAPHPSIAAHKAIGSSFACRYLSHDSGKNLTWAEAHQLRSNGIDVVVVWESTAQRALAGYRAGVSDAQAAINLARECGIPEHRPIYFGVDFDATAGNEAAISEYFRGVADVLGHERTGAYAGYWVIKRLFDAGRIAYGWQTYAWSGGNVDHRAQLYQYSNGHRVGGADCDYNHALKADFGQWGFAPVPPKPAPHPASGVWEFEGTFDPRGNNGEGHFTIQGKSGHDVHMAEAPTTYHAKVTVNAHDGKWDINRNGVTHP